MIYEPERQKLYEYNLQDVKTTEELYRKFERINKSKWNLKPYLLWTLFVILIIIWKVGFHG